jgi:hypothetical protein
MIATQGLYSETAWATRAAVAFIRGGSVEGLEVGSGGIPGGGYPGAVIVAAGCSVNGYKGK